MSATACRYRRPSQSPLLVFAVAIAVATRSSSGTYCDENLYPEDGTRRQSSGVQFTKELSTSEYGPLGSFKTLNCCGQRYMSIEWFKDNRPYPWPSDVSSFILNPESANQTIYTRSLTPSDHGLYTCQLSNQTNILDHSMKLVTIDVKSYWGDPLPTYQIPSNHYSQPGDSVRLYCEGFVGKVNLPDAVNTIKWEKIGGNQTIDSNKKYTTEKVIRENNQVLGAFLYISNIEEADYGQYMCSISNTDDQIVKQFTNITKPVFKNVQSDRGMYRFYLLLAVFTIFDILLLIFAIWKCQWFCFSASAVRTLQKTFQNDKYALSEKTVHNVIVFHDESNEDSAIYLVEKMDHNGNYITKKHHIDFEEDFIKMHTDLIKGFDFAIYLVSSEDTITSSFMTKSTKNAFVKDSSSPKKYIIECGNMPVTPTKSWCDRVMTDLSSEHNERTIQNSPNKLIRVA